MSVYLNLTGGVQAVKGQATVDISEDRARGFASAGEAWAELKGCLETLKKQADAAEKLHKEMWESIKEENDDAFSAYCAELERCGASLAVEWIRAAALARIAWEGPSLPEET